MECVISANAVKQCWPVLELEESSGSILIIFDHMINSGSKRDV